MITKPLLIQILLFLIEEKESDIWFITDYRFNGKLIELSTQELISDTERDIKYHWSRSEIIDSEQLDGFKVWNRNSTIKNILRDETQIFSSDETLKLELLRIKSYFDKNKSKVITKDFAIKEYSSRFKSGDKVKYKNMPGIITYRHKGDDLKFTVKVGTTYHKYILYNELTRKVKKDYSNVSIPKEFKEISTTNLLFLLKESRKYGYRTGRFPSLSNVNYDSEMIKAELSNREHIKNKKK